VEIKKRKSNSRRQGEKERLTAKSRLLSPTTRVVPDWASHQSLWHSTVHHLR
jgi:hypothetical protein